jgi:hypothetical protein
VLAAFSAYSVWVARTNQARIRAHDEELQELSGRLATVTDENEALRAKVVQAVHQLESRQESAQAASVAGHSGSLRRQNRADTRYLRDGLDQQQARLAAIAAALDRVEQRGARNQADVNEALAAVWRNDGLIARNREAIQKLLQVAEQDRTRFEVAKTGRFVPVGPILLRLEGTDREHQRCTISVMVGAKRMQKRDLTALERMGLYLPGARQAAELVVQEVDEERISGYLATPHTPRVGS